MDVRDRPFVALAIKQVDLLDQAEGRPPIGGRSLFRRIDGDRWICYHHK